MLQLDLDARRRSGTFQDFVFELRALPHGRAILMTYIYARKLKCQSLSLSLPFAPSCPPLSNNKVATIIVLNLITLLLLLYFLVVVLCLCNACVCDCESMPMIALI